MKRSRPRAEDFTVGWLCALPVERAAAELMLDDEYDEGWRNSPYTLGRIDKHNVVIACLPAGLIGTNSAAVVATKMQSDFRSIRIRLMVGIGGGVPSAESDVRLGDVVISQPHMGRGGVVQYDFGKTGVGGKLKLDGFLNAPPTFLLDALAKLRANEIRGKSKLSTCLSTFDQQPNFTRQRAGPDVLFQPNYNHTEGATCEQCCKDMEVKRPLRKDQNPVIHYGTIASGNQVIKDGKTRDARSSALGGVLCFEMEAAGLMNNFPCLVIRGICDYADSHKNKAWQPYAAATAAACAKEILSLVPAADNADKHRLGIPFSALPSPVPQAYVQHLTNF